MMSMDHSILLTEGTHQSQRSAGQQSWRLFGYSSDAAVIGVPSEKLGEVSSAFVMRG